MSLGIVEAHGGSLTVNVRARGRCILITLPVGTVKNRTDAVPSSIGTASQRTILIVDDEAEIRESLAEILCGAQHLCNGQFRARSVRADGIGYYDVILTDIRMPDLEGAPLSRIERRWLGVSEARRLCERGYARSALSELSPIAASRD